MAKQQETPEPDQQDVLQVLGEIAENAQRLMHGVAGRHCAVNGAASPDPLNLRSTILELTARIMADPASMLQAQLSLWQDYLRLWQNAGQRLLGQAVDPHGRARRDRPPLSGSGVGRPRGVRLHQAVLSADLALAGRHRQWHGRLRRQDQAEDRFLHPAVRGRDGAQQLRGHQPGGPARHAGEPRHQSAARA